MVPDILDQILFPINRREKVRGKEGVGVPVRNARATFLIKPYFQLITVRRPGRGKGGGGCGSVSGAPKLTSGGPGFDPHSDGPLPTPRIDISIT